MRRRQSDSHLPDDGGRSAAQETELSPLQSSQIRSGKGPLKKLARRIRKIFVRGAERSPNPASVGSSSNAWNPIPDHVPQAPPADTAPAPEQDTGQATNSCAAKNKPDPKEKLGDAHKAATRMRDISGKVLTIINDGQSGCDAVGAVSSTVQPLLQLLTVFNSIAEEIAKIHPYARVAMSILTYASKMILAQKQRDDDVRALLEKISQVYAFMHDDAKLADVESIQILWETMARQMMECADFITHYSDITSAWKRLGKTILKETSATIQNYNNVFDTLMQRFRDLAIRDMLVNVHDIGVKVHRMVDDLDFKDMVYVDGAGRENSKCCLPRTRASILSEIKEWINRTGEDAQSIFWLSGTAGKGKSAIAHTIAKWFDERGGPGACFCFDRTREAERRHEKMFTTIARDLADRDPIIRRTLASAVRGNELRHTKDIERQWENFILGPVGAASQAVDTPVLVVIDALDESGDARSREEILRMLTGNVDPLSTEPTKLPAHFRVLVTSRPLGDIHESLHGMQHVHHVSIDDISLVSAELDIQHYISTKLVFKGDTFNDSDFQRLAKKSDGLFEWARLACEYIKGTNVVGPPPRKRLESLAAGKSSEGTGLLDDMYSLILEEIMPKKKRKDAIPMFCSVMGQILVSSEPLPASALTAMRNHFPCEEERYDVNLVIGKLGSLVTGTDSTASVRPLHASFYDFLTDESRSNEFFVNRTLITSDLAFASLRVLEHGLYFNMCFLESSYLPNSAVLDLEERVKMFIPAELSYSCRYWGTHVEATPFQSVLAEEIRTFLNAERLLFWLEALALMKGLSGSVATLTSIANWFMGHAEYADISSAISDTQRFIRTFAPAIVHSTPHLYLSAIPFSPTQSTIFEKFTPNFPRTPRVLADHAVNWPPMEKILRVDSRVFAVAISPDGRWIVSGLDDKTIQMWDADTGEALGARLQGHTHFIYCVVISPDGTRIVSCSADNTIRIWDAETGNALRAPLQGHTDSVYSVAISPDGTRVVSGSQDTTIRIWHAETGEALSTPLRGHTRAVNSVAMSPDGTRIVSGSRDNTIRIWDAETGDALHAPLEGHTDSVCSVAISPDGSRIVSGSHDRTIRMWLVETGEALVPPLQGHTGSVNCVAISPDGTRIVSGSNDGTIRMWHADTGKAMGVPLQGHTYSVSSVTISQDGTRIVSGSEDHTIRMWDADTSEALDARLEEYTGAVYSVAISTDGTRIVSRSKGATIRTWDAKTGKALSEAEVFCGVPEFLPPWAVAISQDGTRFVLYSEYSKIEISDAKTGKALDAPFGIHTDSIWSVALSPDETRIVSGSHDKTIRMWDAETKGVLGPPLLGHTGAVWSVAVSPDGTRIVSGSRDKTIRMWDVMTGKALGAPLRGHTNSVYSVAISPDGSRIVSGSRDKTIRTWDAETGKAWGAPLQGHTDSVSSVAISLDGTRIVSGSYDETIRIWDAETGKALGAPLQGHTDKVMSVAISPDGTRIVSGSKDMTVRIWDAETGKALVAPLLGHTGAVFSVAISLDGASIVSGSEDRTIWMWDADTGKPLDEPLQEHTESVCSVAISSDGARIVSGSEDCEICIWDADTGDPLDVSSIDCVVSVAISPDARCIVSGLDNTLQIWDAETGEALSALLQGHTDPVLSITISLDGTRIVSGSHDKTIRMWDAETGEALGAPLQGHTRSVSSVAISPDGTRIVSGSYDDTIRIWDAKTGKTLGAPLQGHTDSVLSVAISPDGTCVVSGSDDKTVRIWDAETGKALGPPLQGHNGSVLSVAISPDGTRILSGSKDGTIRVWPLKSCKHSQAFNEVVSAIVCFSSDSAHALCSTKSFLGESYISSLEASDTSSLEASDTSSLEPSHLIPTEERWIVGPEGRLLIWIPNYFPSFMYAPGNALVIPDALQLDLSHFSHGTSWQMCRK